MRTCGGAAMALPPDADGEAGQRLAVDLVGIEPAQFLGHQLGGVPAVQRDPPVLLARPLEGGGPPVWPADRDVPVAHGEPYLGDPGALGHLPRERGLEPLGQPRRDQVGARVPRLGRHRTAGDLAMRLVKRGRQNRTPGRGPGPAQVGVPGAVAGGQVTTGVSGTSSGMTTESACRPIDPYIRSSTVCPGAPSPVLISASRRGSAPASLAITPSTRQGCSRPAWLAARTASYWADSSVMMIRLSTTPVVGPPIWSRVLASASSMARVLVSVRSIIIVLSPPCSTAGARPCRPGRSARQRRPGPACPPGTARAWRAWPRSPRSGRGSSTTARPPGAAGTAAGRRSARRAAAARRPRGWTR